MRKEELLKKSYSKADARLVVFNYKEVVMSSDVNTEVEEESEEEDPVPQ